MNIYGSLMAIFDQKKSLVLYYLLPPGCCPGLCAVALSGRIIGCTSTIQASLIVFGLHDNSGRIISVTHIVCITYYLLLIT